MPASSGGEIIARRVRIRGRVQGVGYRDWVSSRALARGVDGWVRNRRDDSVEAVFVGSRAAVERMIADCRRGPSVARVESIDTEPEPVAGHSGFMRLPTV